SIGVDRAARLHVAYNMHNSTWKYARSKGSMPNLIGWDKVDMSAEGLMAPLGTQITYPAFTNSRAGDLYLIARAATFPASVFELRAFGPILQKYEDSDMRWTKMYSIPLAKRLNAPEEAMELPNSHLMPFASDVGWTVYPSKVFFDGKDNIHTCLLWRKGKAGPLMDAAVYSHFQQDGSASFGMAKMPAEIPISIRADEGRHLQSADSPYYAPCYVAGVNDEGEPLIVLRSASKEYGPQLFKISRDTAMW
ncbi:unnamed protein product, partial [Phaeothamnion confervicola]